MFNIFAKAGLAALIALGGISATASTASAGGPEFRFGIYSGGGYGSGPGWHRERDRPRRDNCSPWFAEEKANRMGLRRARVVDVSPRRVVVAGYDRHGRDRVVFANERGCPVIRR